MSFVSPHRLSSLRWLHAYFRGYPIVWSRWSRACLAGVCFGVATLPGAESDRLTSEPLAARSGPRGATLFTTLASGATGVSTENRYADPRMWWELYQEFSVGAIGTGVAVGDYDGDGRPDLFVVSKTESCRLFRNLGGWRFEDVTVRAGVVDPAAEAAVWKQGAAFADVDNDGRLDLYLCRFGAPNRLYMNQGNGTFREEAAARGLAVVDASGMAAFADYDRDGWLDVYLQTNLYQAKVRPNGQTDRLFRNTGRGVFSDVTTRAGITGETQGHSATWWDYDNDGWPDLYVANDFAAPDQLYRNHRDGTFRNVAGLVLPYTPYSSMGSDLGDVDNDGRIDFLVADMAAVGHVKDQRGMADSRTISRDPRASAEAAPQILRNTLFLNTGVGRHEEAAQIAGLAATDWTWSVRFEDLDNDGRLDLHVTNGMVRELHNADLLARMMIAESPAERVRIMRASPVLAETNLAYRNLGDLGFEETGSAWGLAQRGVSFGAAYADFDGDGDLDVVFSNYQAGATLLRNDSDSGGRVIVALRGTFSNRFGVGATVRLETDAGIQVRQLVLARGYLSTSEPVLHFGLGADTRIRRLIVEWPGGARQTYSDLAIDRRYLVTEPERDAQESAPLPSTSVATLFRNATDTFRLALDSREEEIEETATQALLPARHNRRGPGLAVGDLDGDGIDEIVLSGTTRDGPRQLRRSANGGFDATALETPAEGRAVNDGPALLFDANDDGRIDLLLAKGGVSLPSGAPAYQPWLWLNEGRGSLRPAAGALPPLAVSAGALAAADLNRDGRLEIFLGGRVVPGAFPLAPRSYLLSRKGDRFEDVTAALAPGLADVGMVTGALWSDVDGDGWIDLLVTLDWGGVRYWRNRDGQALEDRSTEAGFAAAGSGWWTSISAADFNGDGQPDYAVGNVGLNTPYRASARHPALLYLGEFREGAAPVLIEADHDGDRIVPRRAARHLGAAVPSIRKRYPKINDYARATLADLVGESALASAQRWQATEFRSGVFLSQGGGRYRFEPLPTRAQLAPLQGLFAGDVDGDGKADLYAVQNSRAPIPSVGRFEGGISVLLRGDGRGQLTAVPQNQSGLVVPGDAKALVVSDLDQDGWPDFVVSRNDETLLAFRNQPGVDRRFLQVRLEGPPGNPLAAGSRVTMEAADGATQTSEVYAGSGWASQSTANLFFGFEKDRPPLRLRVRWPSGRTTEHVPDLAAPVQRLRAPTQ